LVGSGCDNCLRRKRSLAPFCLVFSYIASRTVPALCLEISRHPLEARRQIQKVCSDFRPTRLIRKLSEFFGKSAVCLG